MNERIKELAKQCWKERWEGQLHFDNEKFAELIVKECAELVDRAVSDGGVDGRVLKQHFGVQE